MPGCAANGAAGKGFAVVADEVRSLASKSSEAGQRTTVLLNQTVESMDEGVQAAQDASDSVLDVVSHAEEMGKLIVGIADYTKHQDETTAEITQSPGSCPMAGAGTFSGARPQSANIGVDR